MAERMVELAKVQVGFLGMESAISKIGIIVSYRESKIPINRWKSNWEYLLAQE